MSAIHEARPQALTIEFDGFAASFSRRGLRTPLPVLGSDGRERIFAGIRFAGEVEGVRLFTAPDLLLGCALQRVGEDLAGAAQELYGRVLHAADGAPLYRIWNYVPAINRRRQGLENYRAFSLGRARAFEAAAGVGFARTLPAGSAVGCGGRDLCLIFAAGQRPARTFENPEQIPAYEYPRAHGPRPPSFSRAAAARAGGRHLIFISGTAAIKGHRTVAPGDLTAQLECTLDNLRLISRAAGAGPDLGASAGFARHFKVYLRRAADLPRTRVALQRSLLRPDDAVIWLRADLCRSALLVEIEATLVGPKR